MLLAYGHSMPNFGHSIPRCISVMLITPLNGLVPIVVSATSHQLALFLVLAVLSVSYSFATRRIERLRRGLTSGQVANVLDIWTMAAALLLSPLLVAGLAVIVYAAEWPSRRIVAGGRPARYLTSAAVLTLAAVTACWTHQVVGGGALGVAAAIVVCAAVNDLLLVPVIWLFGDPSILPKLFTLRNHVVDTVAKSFGVFLALAISWHAPAAFLAFPFIYAAHRFALYDSIRTTAAYDTRTGLWSVDGWSVRAAELVRNAPGQVVVLLVDLEVAAHVRLIRTELADLFGPVARPPRLVRLRTALRGQPAEQPSLGPHVMQHAIGRYQAGQVAIVCEVDFHSLGVILIRNVRQLLRDADVPRLVGTVIGEHRDLDELVESAANDLAFYQITEGVTPRW